MDLLITKDMYYVAIPVCIMNDGSAFQFESYVRGYHAYLNIWEYVNHDLSLLCHWLRANKLSLNTSKTEIITFRPKNKQMNKKLNFRISAQKIDICNKVQYLGVALEENLEWNTHLNTLKLKLNRAIGLLCKIRLYVPKFLSKTLYYTIFHSHLIYACQIWGQSSNTLNEI